MAAHTVAVAGEPQSRLPQFAEDLDKAKYPSVSDYVKETARLKGVEVFDRIRGKAGEAAAASAASDGETKSDATGAGTAPVLVISCDTIVVRVWCARRWWAWGLTAWPTGERRCNP